MEDTEINKLTETWLRIFDDVLDATAREKPKPGFNSFIPHADYIQPADIELQSEIEIWSLFETGIQTLKKDKYSGSIGSLELACRRISLRNTPLAQSLGVRPPLFASEHLTTETEQRHPALARLGILLDTAQKDLENSRDILLRTLNFLRQHAHQSADLTPRQQMLFSYLVESTDHNLSSEDHEDPLHDQMTLTLNAQISAYKRVHARVSAVVDDINPPEPQA